MTHSNDSRIYVLLVATLLAGIFLGSFVLRTPPPESSDLAGQAIGATAGVGDLMAATTTTCITSSCGTAATTACNQLAQYPGMKSALPQSVQDNCNARLGSNQFGSSFSLTSLQPQLPTMTLVQLETQTNEVENELTQLSAITPTISAEIIQITTAKESALRTITTLDANVKTLQSQVNVLSVKNRATSAEKSKLNRAKSDLTLRANELSRTQASLALENTKLSLMKELQRKI